MQQNIVLLYTVYMWSVQWHIMQELGSPFKYKNRLHGREEISWLEVLPTLLPSSIVLVATRNISFSFTTEIITEVALVGVIRGPRPGSSCASLWVRLTVCVWYVFSKVIWIFENLSFLILHFLLIHICALILPQFFTPLLLHTPSLDSIPILRTPTAVSSTFGSSHYVFRSLHTLRALL